MTTAYAPTTTIAIPTTSHDKILRALREQAQHAETGDFWLIDGESIYWHGKAAAVPWGRDAKAIRISTLMAGGVIPAAYEPEAHPDTIYSCEQIAAMLARIEAERRELGLAAPAAPAAEDDEEEEEYDDDGDYDPRDPWDEWEPACWY